MTAERDARAKADGEHNRQLYENLLAQGNAALQKQQYDTAIESFNSARKSIRPMSFLPLYNRRRRPRRKRRPADYGSNSSGGKAPI